MADHSTSVNKPTALTKSLGYLQTRISNAAVNIANQDLYKLSPQDALTWCKCLDILNKLLVSNDQYSDQLIKGQTIDLVQLSDSEILALAKKVALEDKKHGGTPT